MRAVVYSSLMFFFLSSALFADELLTWQDCIAEAYKNNPNILYAKESIEQKKAEKNVTKSTLFPQVEGSVSTSRTTTSGDISRSSSYGLSLSQLIFDGNKSIEEVKAAKETLNATVEAYRFTSADVRHSLRTAFIDIIKAQELITVSEEIKTIRQINKDLISLQYDAGLEHRGAFLTAVANLASAQHELSKAKRDLTIAQRALINALGREEYSPIAVETDFTIKEAAEEKPSFDSIIANNPLILEATAKKNAALYAVKSAYGTFSPKITGSGGVQKTGSQWPPQKESWDIGISLTLPLYKGQKNISGVARSKALYRQSEAKEQLTYNNCIETLEKTWMLLRDAIEAVDVQKALLDATEERSKIAKAQYSTGFISFDTWIIIENDLVNAKKTFLDTKANALYAEAEWIMAKGETLEYVQ